MAVSSAEIPLVSPPGYFGASEDASVTVTPTPEESVSARADPVSIGADPGSVGVGLEEMDWSTQASQASTSHAPPPRPPPRPSPPHAGPSATGASTSTEVDSSLQTFTPSRFHTTRCFDQIPEL